MVSLLFCTCTLLAMANIKIQCGWWTRNQTTTIGVVFFFFFKRPTARLIGPETMIHSPTCFALPCTGPFHKINTGYERKTLYLPNVQLLCLCHFTKPTRDQGAALMLAYVCTHVCSLVPSRITHASTIMHNSYLHYNICRQRVTHDCASILC